MKKSLKQNIMLGVSVLSLSGLGANCSSMVQNTLAPYDEGRMMMNSAIANALNIDVAYDPKKDPHYTGSNLGTTYRENMLSDDATYVRNLSQPQHDQWHKPDTLKESIAMKLGQNTVGGVCGLIGAAVLAILIRDIKQKKKKS